MPQYVNTLKKFFSGFDKSLYKKGEIIVRGNDIPKGIFFVNSGQIKQYFLSEQGSESIMRIYKRNEIFPMFWGVSKKNNLYYFEALRDSYLQWCPRKELVKFLKNTPKLTYSLLSNTLTERQLLYTRMTSLISGTAQTQLIAVLVNYVTKNNPDHTSEKIKLHITQNNLAAMTGISRETVSRELKKLKKKKLIAYNRNSLMINNFDGLKNKLLK